jgi:hypothetical protein
MTRSFRLRPIKTTGELALSPTTRSLVQAAEARGFIWTAFDRFVEIAHQPVRTFHPECALPHHVTKDEAVQLLDHQSPVVRAWATHAVRHVCPERAEYLVALLCDTARVEIFLQPEFRPRDPVCVWHFALVAVGASGTVNPVARALVDELVQSEALHVSLSLSSYVRSPSDPSRGQPFFEAQVAAAQNLEPDLMTRLSAAFGLSNAEDLPFLRHVVRSETIEITGLAGAALLLHDGVPDDEKANIERFNPAALSELESQLSGLCRKRSPKFAQAYAAARRLVAANPNFAYLQRTLDWCVSYDPRTR